MDYNPHLLSDELSVSGLGEISRGEHLRKLIHLGSLAVPWIAFRSLALAQALLLAAMVLYLFSELMKLKGRPFFAHSLTRKTQRRSERGRLAPAPLYLALGVLGSISFLSQPVSLVTVYQVGLSDTMATYVGKKWGRRKLPLLKSKSWLGSAAYFISALVVSMMVLSPEKALLASILGTALEALSPKDTDNLFVPLGVGTVLSLL